MQRDVDLKEISDGRLYTRKDMVRVGCRDCQGCSSCCHGMEDTIVLDPYDIWQMGIGLQNGFESLLNRAFELVLTEGVILPHLKTAGKEEQCVFLGTNGRCTIHPYRPGICRLFPLARIYEEDDFRYFIQVHECPATGKSKVRIEKWLGIPDLPAYEAYLKRWHAILRKTREKVNDQKTDEERRQKLLMLILRLFYERIDPSYPFYEQFEMRAGLYEEEYLKLD